MPAKSSASVSTSAAHTPAPASAPVTSAPERFPFQKVLIANRGEIAVRVIRACRDMGLTSVAVYSDADRTALHVRMADEAVHIGGAAASESYLNMAKLIAAARQTGAGAIHPGYGFLSENPDFADLCASEGIVFVGPPGRVMREMGEKTAARRKAQEIGVPVTPGYDAGLEDAREATALAERIGYPILLKAASGGGGKGIRFVHRAEDLESALRLARSEAQGAFGDSTVYLEKAVSPARHIEVQIIGDQYGNVIHLGERECSIQRRHQKLIEESPSVALDDAQRARFTDAAVKLARAVGYVNAGTCEFLLGPDGSFYFLEVNARLQVEHPVTELRTGIDLVREQLRVAAGLPLSRTQEQVTFRGHAIEARITAEDPLNNFLPASGAVAGLEEPMGPGVRLDSGVYAGMRIPLYYDSMLAKLICWGEDRTEAIDRLRRALDEYTIAGVRTTIPFARWLLRQPRFLAGDFSTDFIAEEWRPGQAPGSGTVGADATSDGASAPDGASTADGAPALASDEVAALLAALVAQEQGQATTRRITASDGEADGSRWRAAGRRAAIGGW
ncbi:MAG TPA: acetyl-CoA carboxylase biotin carboxylase subunit [Ktedonobacterales bacterium]|nr:acetyl-CoA carboxylase biotin carboxylase subunit [Ktedonobacterales bacterium]